MKLTLDHVELPLAHLRLQVDVELRARVTALFGPSGAGKTSLIELVAGLRAPASGRISLDDQVLSDATTRRRVPPEARAIGYVPQDAALFPHLSVRRNLLYGHRAGAAVPASLTFEHVVEVLEMQRWLERDIGSLSGGEKQRAALGRALLAAPRLLLLDEPLAGLDRPLRQRLLPYLQRVRDEFGVPMIYISHAPDEVVALSEEVIVLEAGRVTGRGAPADVFVASSETHYVRRR